MRPTLKEMGDVVESAIASFQSNRYRGIEKKEDELPEHMRLDLRPERWPVGGPISKKRSGEV